MEEVRGNRDSGELNDMRFDSGSTMAFLVFFKGHANWESGTNSNFSPHQRQPVVPTPGSEKVPSPTPPSQCSHVPSLRLTRHRARLFLFSLRVCTEILHPSSLLRSSNIFLIRFSERLRHNLRQRHGQCIFPFLSFGWWQLFME